MKKRILSFVLALLIVLTVLPPQTFAVDMENTSEGKEQYAKITTESFFYVGMTPGAMEQFAGKSDFPALMVVMGVDSRNGTTYYQLKAAENNKWPVTLEGGIQKLTDGVWVKADYVVILEFCEICQKYDCGLDHTTDPSDPIDPELPTISGTVTDSEGNPVTDANGEPLVITVTGDLPEGAIVSASIPEIDGEKRPNVFDIKVLAPNAEGELVEWQPIDDNKTVTISIPVDEIEDGKDVDVYHIIDYAPDINGDEVILNIEDISSDTIDILSPAIDAFETVYGDRQHIAVGITEKIEVVNGTVSVSTDSFSIYQWNTSENKFDEVLDPDANQVTILNSSAGNGTVFKFYATAGQDFDFITQNTSTTRNPYTFLSEYDGTTTTSKVSASDLVNHVEDETYIIFVPVARRSATLTIPSEVDVGDIIWIKFDAWNDNFIQIIIVRELEIKYDQNLVGVNVTVPNAELIATDGVNAKYKISSDVPIAGEGYDFVEWNTSPAGDGESYDPGDEFVPTRDTTLYAIWRADEYTVTFDPNGGSGGTSNKTVIHGDSIVMPAAPERENYTFLGWSATKTGYSEFYQPGDDLNITSSFTMYAIWGVDLTITMIGGTVSMMAVDEYEYTDISERPEFTKIDEDSYHLECVEGYYQNARFRFVADTGKSITSYVETGAAHEFDLAAVNRLFLYLTEHGITEDTVITVTTEENKYIVSYVTNGGSAITSDTITYGDDITLPAGENAPTKPGYSFAGWYDNSQLTGNAISELTNVTENKVVYAKWTSDGYTISYDLAGGTVNGTNPVSYTIESGNITLINPTKEGYTFLGWTGTALTEATMTVTIPTGSTGNRQYTATWTINQYTINYVLTDDNNITGTNHADNPTSYTVESGPITLKDPTPPTGYKFVRWAEGNTIAAGSTGDKTFTAVWELALADLEITVSGHRDADQSYVFAMYRGTGNNKSFVMNVVIPEGETSVTIKDLPVDTYTVTPVSGWAWRLKTDDNGQVELNGNQTVEFKWTLIDSLIYWLNGYGYDKKGG